MRKVNENDMIDKKKLLESLLSCISENKKNKFSEIICHRTRHVTIVLEDIFQPHNASAVLRSCDCFGIQDVHIIENNNVYEDNPDISLGSSKWLTFFKYNKEPDNTPFCLTSLKKQGYKIVATTPHENDFTPENFPIDQKFALVFGTELQGLTKNAFDFADAFIRIPMVGFTESLNISVSAALLLFTLTERLKKSEVDWRLSEEDKIEVKLQWARNTIRKSEIVEREFLKKLKNEHSDI